MEDNLDKNKETEQNEETKTYTLEEVQAMLQKEGDRRVSEALKKAEKKKEEAVKEAERLAKMSEQERYEESLKKKERELEEKERKLALLENTNEASKALSQRGISIALTELVVASDADEMMKRIKLLETEFNKSVEAKVKDKLAGNSPKKGGDNKELTADSFKQLSVSEQQELFNKDPELYNKFMGI